jgi:TonB family protein
VCVGANGKQTGAPSILQSSGKTRLDDAAIKYAQAQRFSPATEDGKAVDGCIDFRVKFALR